MLFFKQFLQICVPKLLGYAVVKAISVVEEVVVVSINDMVPVSVGDCGNASSTVTEVGTDFLIHGCVLDDVSNVIVNDNNMAFDIETFSLDNKIHVAVAKNGDFFCCLCRKCYPLLLY